MDKDERMPNLPRSILRKSRILLIIVATIVASIVVLRAFDARRLPDLSDWHEVRLTEEFDAGQDADSLPAYLAFEDAVRGQIDREIEAVKATAVHRFNPTSVFNSQNHVRDWNRTNELEPETSTGAALLLHGVSDSPYSMRSSAELLLEQGFHVLALRLPGHGTAPAGLGQVAWEDWRAAVRIGARHLIADSEDGRPFVIVGYSNGGALAIDYALDALEDPSLRAPDRIVLLSPAIGITRFAFFASWNRSLSWLPFFEKFAWSSVLPEYDPYKYNSFPKAAGNETFELTRRVQQRLASLSASDRDALAPILTFVPLVDATVHTDATVARLYDVLNRPRDEMVIYDLNSHVELSEFMHSHNRGMLSRYEGSETRNYQLTVLSNRSPTTRQITARTSQGGESSDEPLALQWPLGIYSLSHVALPFPPDDPWYGDGSADAPHGSLGSLHPYGERGLLIVSPAQLMRLRYNPFFSYQARRITEFVAGRASR